MLCILKFCGSPSIYDTVDSLCRVRCHFRLNFTVMLFRLSETGMITTLMASENPMILVLMSCRLEKLVNDPTEGNAWHADHIIPVYRGGGMILFY